MIDNYFEVTMMLKQSESAKRSDSIVNRANRHDGVNMKFSIKDRSKKKLKEAKKI